MRRKLAGDALHQDLRWHDACFAAGLGERDCLLHDGFQLGEPRQPVFVVLHRRERDGVRRVVEVLDAAEVAQRHQVVIELEFVHVVLQRTPEQLVVQLVGRRQGIAIDRVHASQERPHLVLATLDSLQAPVRPAVVVAPVAELRGERRILGQAPLPVLVEQGGEVFRWAGVCHRSETEQHAAEGEDRRFHGESPI